MTDNASMGRIQDVWDILRRADRNEEPTWVTEFMKLEGRTPDLTKFTPHELTEWIFKVEGMRLSAKRWVQELEYYLEFKESDDDVNTSDLFMYVAATFRRSKDGIDDAFHHYVLFLKNVFERSMTEEDIKKRLDKETMALNTTEAGKALLGTKKDQLEETIEIVDKMEFDGLISTLLKLTRDEDGFFDQFLQNEVNNNAKDQGYQTSFSTMGIFQVKDKDQDEVLNELLQKTINDAYLQDPKNQLKDEVEILKMTIKDKINTHTWYKYLQ